MATAALSATPLALTRRPSTRTSSPTGTVFIVCLNLSRMPREMGRRFAICLNGTMQASRFPISVQVGGGGSRGTDPLGTETASDVFVVNVDGKFIAEAVSPFFFTLIPPSKMTHCDKNTSSLCLRFCFIVRRRRRVPGSLQFCFAFRRSDRYSRDGKAASKIRLIVDTFVACVAPKVSIANLLARRVNAGKRLRPLGTCDSATPNSGTLGNRKRLCCHLFLRVWKIGSGTRRRSSGIPKAARLSGALQTKREKSLPSTALGEYDEEALKTHTTLQLCARFYGDLPCMLSDCVQHSPDGVRDHPEDNEHPR